jgi:hypothetical protein
MFEHRTSCEATTLVQCNGSLEMKKSHFAPKFRALMLSALRILTLITFTVHAVLGCCLSHGDCMREQAGTLANDCCDSPTHGDCEDGHEHHGDHDELESGVIAQDTTDSSAARSDSRPFNHEHHRHCDDTNCVFGVSHDAGGSLNSASDGLVLWCGKLDGFKSLNRQYYASRDPYRDRTPQSLCNRAILQVWLI